jgi:hypothetical protein
MKKITLFPLIIVSFLLASCAPQVTPPSPALGEGTGVRETSPTETPQPTLTPTPIAVDGIAEDAEGNKLAYLDGEWMVLPALDGSYKLAADADGVRALDKDGAVKYELDMATGFWVEAESKAMLQANELVETYKLGDKVTVTEKGGQVNVVDNTTRRVLIKTNGERIVYDLVFGVETVAANSCESTPFLPAASTGQMLGQSAQEFAESYLRKLMKELNFIIELDDDGNAGMPVLIDRKERCWGYLNKNRLIYRDAEGVAQELALIPRPIEEVKAFRLSR